MSHKVLCGLAPLVSGPHLFLRAWQGHLSAYVMVAKAGTILAHGRSSSIPVYLCLLTLCKCSLRDLFRHLDFLSLVQLVLKSSWILVFVFLLFPFIGSLDPHSRLRSTPVSRSLDKKDLQSPELLDYRALTLPLGHFTTDVPA